MNQTYDDMLKFADSDERFEPDDSWFESDETGYFDPEKHGMGE
jgi:hypothetical protein